MKVIELYAENVKRLKVVRIVPDGNTVVIGGENGQGKTTVLDCIEMAIAGAKNIGKVPIRTGQSSAKICLNLGELTVERTFSASKGTELVVKNAEGKKQTSPQAILDKLYSTIAFHPLEFANQKPADQVATLRRVVDLDFSKQDAERVSIYQERERQGRDLAQAKARLAALPVPTESTPDEEVSVSRLMDEKAEADRINHAQTELKAKLRDAIEAREAMEEEERDAVKAFASAQEALKDAQETVIEAREKEIVAKKKADVAPNAPVDHIVEKIRNADAINRAVRTKKERAKISAELDALIAERQKMTAAMQAIDDDKAKALASAKWPIEGLGFSADGVTFNGLPFEQASQSERYRVSVAIGTVLNPTLRVLLVPDASLLDKKSMQLLRELATEHDMQMWIERVGDADEGAVILEDGEVQK